jgi:hypothetical protein
MERGQNSESFTAAECSTPTENPLDMGLGSDIVAHFLVCGRYLYQRGDQKYK